MTGGAKRLCLECGGKGFHWKPGVIVSKRTGEVIADIVEAGERCESCSGTGQDAKSGWLITIGAIILSIVILVFIGFSVSSN